MNDTQLGFARTVLSYLGEFIRTADQKAAFLLIAATALLGWLTNHGASGWRLAIWIGAMVLVSFSAGLAVFAVMPRQHRLKEGLIAWNGILNNTNATEYNNAVLHIEDGGLGQTTRYSYDLSRILRTKYRLLSAAICTFIVGGLMTIILMSASVPRHVGQSREESSCSIKADLQKLTVLNAWNPNLIEMDYLMTNQSAQDYALPDKFRAMRMSADGILHSDRSNIELPSERFFPRNHPVEFHV